MLLSRPTHRTVSENALILVILPVCSSTNVILDNLNAFQRSWTMMMMAYSERSPYVLRRLVFSGACRSDAPWLHDGLPPGGLKLPRQRPSGPSRQPAAQRVIFLRENAR